MLMRRAVHACSTPPLIAAAPPLEQSPVLRRGLPVDNGGLLKATASAKSNRSDQALLRTATIYRDRGDDADLLQVHLATGFPVPLPRYPWSQRPQASELRQRIQRRWADRESRQKQLDVQRAEDQAAQRALYRDSYDLHEDNLLQPVFRASPYVAEVLRAQRPVKQASILFLDEGNQCRSVLAEAVFKELVSLSPLNSFVCVDSASIGPAVGKGLHDPRVMWAAQKAGLNLSRRNIRPFDEQVDIVNYDLVLTMDRFDHDEVYREVAVFDNMNPGGGYSNRVQQLGTFAATNAQQGFLCEDINDPLYGNSGGAQERSALLAAVHELRLACRGLLKKLMHLQTRCISNGITIQVAIAESLQSSVQVEDKVAPLARNHAGSGNRWPVWRKNGAEEAGHFYTIRVVKGQRQVVKRRSAEWGYWRDVRNVKQELQQWLKAHPLEGPHLLPSQSQLRRTGNSSLAVAVTKHGGYKKLFSELPAQRQFSIPQRKGGGHWDDFEVVRQELHPFLHIIEQAPGTHHHSAETSSHTLDAQCCPRSTGGAVHGSSHAADSNGAAMNGSHSGSTAPSSSTGSQQRGNSIGEQTTQERLDSSGDVLSEKGVQVQHRMPTQQELIAAGRMDLLNAMRLWGGFTAVADMMGVRPNTRHNRSEQGLREEVQELIRQQHWPHGFMPSASQLQAAGQHCLIAAIRQRGGFKSIAAQIGLSPQRLDKRGRKPKKPATRRPEESAEQAGDTSGELVKASEQAQAYETLNDVRVQLEVAELQRSQELELV